MDEERDYSPADEYAEDYSEDAVSELAAGELDAAEIDAYAAEYGETPLEGEIVAPDETVEDAAEPYDEASEESSPVDNWDEDETAGAYASDPYAAPPRPCLCPTCPPSHPRWTRASGCASRARTPSAAACRRKSRCCRWRWR